MVTLTGEARKFLEAQRSEAPGLKWYLIVHWRKGEMENWRGASGDVKWERHPDPGWSAEFVGYRPEDMQKELGESLMANVRLLTDPAFPGGVIEVEQGSLRVKANAV